MNVTESKQVGPLTGPVSSASFTLKGGAYTFAAVAQTFGQQAILQMMAGDGATFVPVPSSDGDVVGDAALLNNGTCTVHVPGGTFRITLTGIFANFYGTVSSIPS